MIATRPLAAFITVGLAWGCTTATRPSIDVATTSSVQNAGLLNHLLPVFEAEAGVTVRVHAVGSGRALQMLSEGAVDAVISHAPESEQRLLSAHPDWSYRKLASNWFAVVGTAADPARIKNAADVVEAFRRIADSNATFVSRGDQSGTHERELAFWNAAGRRPNERRLLISGRGMAQALRHADEVEGYTLTDLPTFWQLGDDLDLQVLVEGDRRLLNTYAIIHRPGRAEAAVFATWLLSEAGRTTMAAFMIEGRRAFEPWPDNCAGGAPSDLPC